MTTFPSSAANPLKWQSDFSRSGVHSARGASVEAVGKGNGHNSILRKRKRETQNEAAAAKEKERES